MTYAQQIWYEKPLTKAQHIIGVKCHAVAIWVNQSSNCIEISHIHQNVAKAALEHA